MAARYTLETEVQYVKGVGTKLAQVLSKLNLYTLGDLLFHLPRRYEDRRQFRKIAHARPGDAVTVSGKLVTVDNVKVRNLTLTKAYLDDGSGVLELVWYNQPYMKDTLNKLRNSQIVAYGIIKESPYGLQMETPEWEDLPDGADPDSLLSVNRIVPIYPLTEGIRQKRMRQIIWNAVQYAHLAPEILPRSVRERLGLMPIQQAIAQIHFPDSEQAIDPARQRLVFEEFFLMQLGVGHAAPAHAPRARNRHAHRRRPPERDAAPHRAVRTHQRPKARDQRNLERYGATAPDEPPAARRCRVGQDHRRGGGNLGSRRQPVPSGDDGAHRDSGGTALHQPAPPVPAAGHQRRTAGRQAKQQAAAAGARAHRHRARHGRRRHARADSGRRQLRAAGACHRRRAAPLRRAATRRPARQGRRCPMCW
jgi:hypothetical protein